MQQLMLRFRLIVTFLTLSSRVFFATANSPASLANTSELKPVPPAITASPESVTVPYGSQAELRVQAIGPSLKYQWIRDGNKISWGTGPLLLLLGSVARSGNYWVEVSNDYGSVTSQVARVSFLAKPFLQMIKQQRRAAAGSDVFVSPDDFRYDLPAPTLQWSKDGTLLPNQTNKTLRLLKVQPSDEGYYQLSASNMSGVAITTPWHLTVTQNPEVVWQSFRTNITPGSAAPAFQPKTSGGISTACSPELINYDRSGTPDLLSAETFSTAAPYPGGGWVLTRGFALPPKTFLVDSTGKELWNNPVGGTKISVSSGGEIFILENAYPLKIAHLDGSNGRLLDSFDVPPQTYSFEILKADSKGDVLIAGTISKERGTRSFVQKCSAHGDFRWNFDYDDPEGVMEAPTVLEEMIDGGFFLAIGVGKEGFGDYTEHYLALKINSDGQLLWKTEIPWHTGSVVVAAAFDAAGNAWVTGTAGTAKLDPSGHLLWQVPIGHPIFGVESGRALAVDSAGNCYIAGYSPIGPRGYDSVSLEKFDSDGHPLWVTQVGDGLALLTLMAPQDEPGTIYVGASGAYGQNGEKGFFLQKLRDNVTGQPPKIIAQPLPSLQKVPYNSEVTYHVTASGSEPLVFQWYAGGYEIPGGTNASITLPSFWDNEDIRAEVRNFTGYAVSDPVVFENAGPPFTYINSRNRISGCPFMSVSESENLELHNDYQPLGQEELKTQWLFNGTPIPGAEGEQLQLGPIKRAQAGTYTYRASNRFGTNQNSVHLIVTTDETLSKAPVILSSPKDEIIVPGTAPQFDITATSPVPMEFQWIRNNWPSGATNTVYLATNSTLIMPQFHSFDAGQYSVAVANEFGVTFSPPFELKAAGPYWRATRNQGSGLITMTLEGGDAKTYRFETSTNFSTWVPFWETNPGQSGTEGFSLISSETPRFFRAVEIQR